MMLLFFLRRKDTRLAARMATSIFADSDTILSTTENEKKQCVAFLNFFRLSLVW
jgi:hypothetical protein